MRRSDMAMVRAECYRLLDRIKELEKLAPPRDNSDCYSYLGGQEGAPAAHAAVRRASLDLTRALAKMRNG